MNRSLRISSTIRVANERFRPVEGEKNQLVELELLEKRRAYSIEEDGDEDRKENNEGIRQKKAAPWRIIKYENSKPVAREIKPDDWLYVKFRIGEDDKNSGSGFRILICITMYNEAMDDLSVSLLALEDNIQKLLKQGLHENDIGIVIIFDGIQKTHSSVLDSEIIDEKAKEDIQRRMQHIGDEGYRKDTALLFATRLKIKSPLYFCFKISNNGKLSSHKWFLRGFCEHYEPEYFWFMDCGAKPEAGALEAMFSTMENEKGVGGKEKGLGGICGTMTLYRQPDRDEYDQRKDHEWYDKLDFLTKLSQKLFSIENAQIFEYTMSHILDKPFESAFGFIHVLPGAFSAYRWEAVKPYPKEDILQEYLKHVSEMSLKERFRESKKSVADQVKEKNMFLAEDRILCEAIFRRGYDLKYCPWACVQVDPVSNLVVLLNQRKRWINGSNYAQEYISEKQIGMCSSCRELRFSLLMCYSKLMSIFTFFLVGIYYIYLEIICKNYFSNHYLLYPSTELLRLDKLIMFTYIILVASLFLYSLIYKARERPHAFYRVSTLLGLFMLCSFVFGAAVIIKLLFNEACCSGEIFVSKKLPDASVELDINREDISILFIITFAIYVVPLALSLLISPMRLYLLWDLLWTLKDYVFFAPTYLHVLVIYAYCNVDDLSWGTKDLETTPGLSQNFKNFKMKKVLFWLSSNMVIAFLGSYIVSYQPYRVYFAFNSAVIFTFISFVRSLGSSIFLLKEVVCRKRKTNVNNHKYREEKYKREGEMERGGSRLLEK